MAIMIGEISCTNEDCKTLIEFQHEGMQYANCKYEVTCPGCGQAMQFTGTSTRKFMGQSLEDYTEAKEIEG